MNKSPLIGVVIPLFNSSAYIKETIHSIIEQSYKNYVCVIVNDGSTDNSLSIVNECVGDDRRYIIIDKKNEGVSIARNKGIDVLSDLPCVPDFVLFLDSDDVIDKYFFELALHSILTSNSDLVATGVVYWYKNKKIFLYPKYPSALILTNSKDIIDHYFAEGLFSEGDLCTFKPLGNKLIRFELVRDLAFSPKYITGQDQEFYFRLINKLNRVTLIPHVLFFYRVRLSSATHAYKEEELTLRMMLRDIVMYSDSLKYAKNDYMRSVLSMKFFQYVLWGLSASSIVHDYNSFKEIINKLREVTSNPIYINYCPSKLRKKILRCSCNSKTLYFYYRLKSYERYLRKKISNSEKNNKVYFD